MIKYFGYNGEEITREQFEELFGPVTVTDGGGPYTQVGLRATLGYPTCIVQVWGETMATTERVRYSWPGGSYEVEVKPTGAEINMGRGENCGGPPNVGPGAAQVAGNKSPLVEGIGWYDNYRHFDIVFRAPLLEPEPEPTPEPEPEPEPDNGYLLTLLHEIAALIDEAVALVEQGK